MEDKKNFKLTLVILKIEHLLFYSTNTYLDQQSPSLFNFVQLLFFS